MLWLTSLFFLLPASSPAFADDGIKDYLNCHKATRRLLMETRECLRRFKKDQVLPIAGTEQNAFLQPSNGDYPFVDQYLVPHQLATLEDNASVHIFRGERKGKPAIYFVTSNDFYVHEYVSKPDDVSRPFLRYFSLPVGGNRSQSFAVNFMPQERKKVELLQTNPNPQAIKLANSRLGAGDKEAKTALRAALVRELTGLQSMIHAVSAPDSEFYQTCLNSDPRAQLKFSTRRVIGPYEEDLKTCRNIDPKSPDFKVVDSILDKFGSLEKFSPRGMSDSPDTGAKSINSKTKK